MEYFQILYKVFSKYSLNESPFFKLNLWLLSLQVTFSLAPALLQIQSPNQQFSARLILSFFNFDVDPAVDPTALPTDTRCMSELCISTHVNYASSLTSSNQHSLLVTSCGTFT